MKSWVERATHLLWMILLQFWEMCLFVSRNCTVTASPPLIQAWSSLPWSQWLYLHESLKKGRVLLSPASSPVQGGGWETVTGWSSRLCHIFHSRAVGLLSVTSHSSMVTSFSKYRKNLVRADLRRSCSHSAPTTVQIYNIAIGNREMGKRRLKGKNHLKINIIMKIIIRIIIKNNN